jgi:phosphoglycerate-specific signal transduction histidine kinase
MNVLTSEALGTLRSDMRRVEMTLGARLEARVAASESLLHQEIHTELQQLRQEMAQFREEMSERLRQICDEVRRHPEGLATSPGAPEQAHHQAPALEA